MHIYAINILSDYMQYIKDVYIFISIILNDNLEIIKHTDTLNYIYCIFGLYNTK